MYVLGGGWRERKGEREKEKGRELEAETEGACSKNGGKPFEGFKQVSGRILIFYEREDLSGCSGSSKMMVTWIMSVVVEMERSGIWRKSWQSLPMDWM